MLSVAVAVPFLPALGVAFAIVGGEGAVGGAAYANALLNVAEEVGPGGSRGGAGRGNPISRGSDPPKVNGAWPQAPPEGREFAMTVASLADTTGIALAGGAALGVHRLVCPAPP